MFNFTINVIVGCCKFEDEVSNTQNVSLVPEENPVPQQEDVQQSVQENPEEEQ